MRTEQSSQGTVSQDFLSPVFFHLSAPPGPIRDDLGPFIFLANFHKVIGLLKRLPGVRDIGETIINFEVRKFLKTLFKCICIVYSTRFRLFSDRVLL